jgi:hypothetical protein
VIQDIEGATSEPSRRRHVAMLSASVAAVSLVLLIVFVVPSPRMDTPPLAASAAPSPARMTVVSASDSTAGLVSYEQALPNDLTSKLCAAGNGSSPSVSLLLDREGRPIAAYTSGKTGRFIPLPQGYVGSGWLTVPCDTSDVFAPRLNRAR